MPSSSAVVDASARSSPAESCRSNRYAFTFDFNDPGISRRVNSASSSAARRDLANAMLLGPSSTSLASSHADSLRALRLVPDSSSTSGGFHRAKSLSPWGDASNVTSSNRTPTSRSASSPGLPTVADASMNRGSPPYFATRRRSLRRIIDTCEPNTPRHTCASSTTTSERRRKKSAHRAWSGSTAACSMSGLLITRFALRRITGRSACGVSPSYTAARICGSFSERICRSWSRASAFVGNKYSAVRFESRSTSAANAML